MTIEFTPIMQGIVQFFKILHDDNTLSLLWFI